MKAPTLLLLCAAACALLAAPAGEFPWQHPALLAHRPFVRRAVCDSHGETCFGSLAASCGANCVSQSLAWLDQAVQRAGEAPGLRAARPCAARGPKLAAARTTALPECDSVLDEGPQPSKGAGQ